MINRIKHFLDSFVKDSKIDAIFLYESTLSGDLTEKGDIDLYVFSDDISYVKRLKEELEKRFGKVFYLNVFSLKDFKSSLEKGLFKHRSRTNIFLFELLTGSFKLVYGRDISKELYKYLPFYEDIDREIVQNILLFKYLIKKFYVNSSDFNYFSNKYVRFSAKLYSLLIHKKFSSFRDSLRDLEKIGIPLPSSDISSILDFLDNLYTYLYKFYKDRYYYKIFSFKFRDFLVYGYYNPNHLNGRVILYLNGLPRPSKIEKQIKFLVSKGFVFLNVFYPGYWESSGVLDFKNLVNELNDLISFVYQGTFFDLFSNSKLDFSFTKVFVLGSSFGATLALNFENSIAISPLTNFEKNKTVIFDLFKRLHFFRHVIRLKNLEDFYYLDPRPSSNTFIIYDSLDPVIPREPLENFISSYKLSYLTLDYGLHGYKLLTQYVLNKILKILK